MEQALYLLEHGDLHAAEHSLEKAGESASGVVLSAFRQAIRAIEDGHQEAAEEAVRQAIQLQAGAVDPHSDDRQPESPPDEHQS